MLLLPIATTCCLECRDQRNLVQTSRVKSRFQNQKLQSVPFISKSSIANPPTIILQSRLNIINWWTVKKAERWLQHWKWLVYFYLNPGKTWVSSRGTHDGQKAREITRKRPFAIFGAPNAKDIAQNKTEAKIFSEFFHFERLLETSLPYATTSGKLINSTIT